jgi:hypothetical protein
MIAIKQRYISLSHTHAAYTSEEPAAHARVSYSAWLSTLSHVFALSCYNRHGMVAHMGQH